jgi:hypothetical protein
MAFLERTTPDGEAPKLCKGRITVELFKRFKRPGGRDGLLLSILSDPVKYADSGLSA